MTIAYPGDAFAVARPWRTHLIALGAVVLAILVFLRRDVADLVSLWWTSTTFGHCLFIVPVSVWLVWTRRVELAQLSPVAWWPGLALVAAGGFGWLIGDAASVALARQLGLVLMLQGAVVTLLGPNVARGIAFPLAYLFFAVPFGEEIEPPLQQVTVSMVMPLLDLVGVPATSDGVLIHAGRYWFEVAEACSGAKFVLAMLAFATLVANVCFNSWRRRAAFMAMALIVPVLANGLRAFATIWAADLTSLERATGIDHIVYGWIFFAVAMAAVIALGWRWFDRAPDDPAFDPATLRAWPGRTLPLGVATALVAATAFAFPAWGTILASRAPAVPARIDLPTVPGWTRAPIDAEAPWAAHHPGADHFVFGRYVDARGDAVDLDVALFGRQREGAELIAFGTGVLREDDRWVRVADLPPIAGGAAVRIVGPTKTGGSVERVVATWYRVGGVTTGDAKIVKLATVKAHLLGGDPRAIALYASVRVRPGADPRATIARFLAAAGGPEAIATRIGQR